MDSIEISVTFKIKPEKIYSAWMESKKHTAMTGSAAEIDPAINGTFTAWDEYISGTTIELVPGKKIVQKWRTTEFPPDSPDSLLEIMLEKTSSGTKLILKHSLIPDGQGENYKKGWKDFYFKPMKKYFA
jgi:activator of HSP90 ATPase